MTELLEKWLASLELHLKYAGLPDADYFAVQPWPKHDRPSRWILELAKQKTLELKGHQESRVAMGDAKFAESLELMGFLANLVGSQHVQRFIPLAEPDKEQNVPPTQTRVAAPAHAAPVSRSNGHAVAPASGDEGDATREMPRVAAPRPEARRPADATPPKLAAPKAPPKAVKKAPAAPAAAKTGPASATAQKKVMADAVRLLKWGKEWHELVDLIARIADRPPAAEIRRILRTHKAEIELQAEGDE